MSILNAHSPSTGGFPQPQNLEPCHHDQEHENFMHKDIFQTIYPALFCLDLGRWFTLTTRFGLTLRGSIL
jgi:hypothetical protein